jgi:glycosidase
MADVTYEISDEIHLMEESEEEEVVVKSKLIQVTTPERNVSVNQRQYSSGSPFKPADFPYSVEDVDHSESIVLPKRQFSHHITRPDRNKTHRYLRWVCGVLVILLVCALVSVAIALVVTATSVSNAWYHRSVIYQCYPQSFQDSDDDGLGDLEGIRQRISHFTELGIKAVWLNPIFESPQKDNGYDISNYTNIYHKYGTLDQFKRLLKDLHGNGIHLLLDFVPNHTSDQHPWFKESRSSRNNSKRGWYIWADGNPGGGPPNNWISVFGNSSWTYDSLTNQWYLHQFSSFQPDLNYRNEEVRETMKDVMRYWLDIGVDGFRVDAVKFLLEDDKLRNETANTSFNETSCDNCYDSLIHNMTTNYDGVHDICREWRQLVNEYSVKHNSEKILMGEIYDDDMGVVMSYYGNANDEFTFPFNFFLLKNQEWTGIAVNSIISRWLDKMPEGGTPNWVLGNHDNPRIASRVGVHLARALNVLILTLPGTPVTYYGEEIMMTDVYVPLDQRRDAYFGRDAERTPMQWDNSTNAGFTNSTPWLPLATNYSLYNVQHERNDPSSMLSLYKMILSELRSQKPAIYDGTYTCINATNEFLIYTVHSSDDSDYIEYYIIAINFSNGNVTTGLDLTFSNVEFILTSYLDAAGGDFELRYFVLRPDEGIIVRGYSSEKSCQRVNIVPGEGCQIYD